MSKGIIVLDVPETCENCLFSRTHAAPLQDCMYCTVLTMGVMRKSQIKRPNWCPINLLPERVHHENYCDGGRYDKGWNECLDEIEGRNKQCRQEKH